MDIPGIFRQAKVGAEALGTNTEGEGLSDIAEQAAASRGTAGATRTNESVRSQMASDTSATEAMEESTMQAAQLEVQNAVTQRNAMTLKNGAELMKSV
jgi:hypothetical protein